MPTILRHGPYRVYFFSHEPHEPPHVHVDRNDSSAKFWLESLRLARNRGFGPKELRQIGMILEQYRLELLEAWYGYHGH